MPHRISGRASASGVITSSPHRFDSMTFDAFAKGLLDRFGQVLPERWRPTPDYEVMFPNRRSYEDFLYHSLGAPPKSLGRVADIMGLGTSQFERRYLLGSSLPADGWHERSVGEWAAERYWEASLRGGSKSHLSFPMIGRLAELLVRFCPMARDALRLTYSHLFMDEFQDTTHVQYDHRSRDLSRRRHNRDCGRRPKATDHALGDGDGGSFRCVRPRLQAKTDSTLTTTIDRRPTLCGSNMSLPKRWTRSQRSLCLKQPTWLGVTVA